MSDTRLPLQTVEAAAWNAYLCGLYGHRVEGVGTSTTTIVYSGYCARCGARVN